MLRLIEMKVNANMKFTQLTGCLLGTTVLAAMGSMIVVEEAMAMHMTLTSTNFVAGGTIPSLHTCEGKDKSPQLGWSGIPRGTKSLVLIVDDPDAPDPAAPKMTWVHWILYNIPPDTQGLKEGIASNELPAGTREGLNDWRRTGYGGPCPPIGSHRYFHKLYALDVVLPDQGKPAKATLEKAMQGHVLDKSELVGVYEKRK